MMSIFRGSFLITIQIGHVIRPDYLMDIFIFQTVQIWDAVDNRSRCKSGIVVVELGQERSETLDIFIITTDICCSC